MSGLSLLTAQIQDMSRKYIIRNNDVSQTLTLTAGRHEILQKKRVGLGLQGRVRVTG